MDCILVEERETISPIITILESEGQRTSHHCQKVGKSVGTNRGLQDQHHSGRPSKITPEVAAFIKAKKEDATINASIIAYSYEYSRTN